MYASCVFDESANGVERYIHTQTSTRGKTRYARWFPVLLDSMLTDSFPYIKASSADTKLD